VAQFFGNPQAVQQDGRLGFGFIAVHFGKFRFQLSGTGAVLFGKIRLGVDGLALDHDLIQFFVPHDNGVENRFLVKGELVLFEDRHAFAGAQDDFALVRFDLAGHDFEEG